MRLNLNRFRRTLSDPSVYREIVHEPLKLSLLYAGLCYLIGGLVLSLVLNFTLIPSLYQEIQQIIVTIQTQLPPQLVLQFTGGELNVSGTTLPLTFTLPQPIPGTDIRTLVTVNPNVTADQISQNHTLILLTGKAAAFITNPAVKSYQLIRFSELMPADQTVTAQAINGPLTKLSDNLALLFPWRWALVPFFICLDLLFTRLLFTLSYTVIIYLVSIVSTRRYGYLNLWKIGLHTIVLADLLSLSIRLIYNQTFPALYSLSYVGLTLIALFYLPPTLEPKTNG